jgi:hypothetical protein
MLRAETPRAVSPLEREAALKRSPDLDAAVLDGALVSSRRAANPSKSCFGTRDVKVAACPVILEGGDRRVLGSICPA